MRDPETGIDYQRPQWRIEDQLKRRSTLECEYRDLGITLDVLNTAIETGVLTPVVIDGVIHIDKSSQEFARFVRWKAQRKKSGRRVLQVYPITGKKKLHQTVKDAAAAAGVQPGTISKALRTGRISAGCWWECFDRPIAKAQNE